MKHCYITIKQYIEQHFAEGCRPDPRTIRAAAARDALEYEVVIRKGKTGRKRYLIDTARPKAKNQATPRVTNPIIARLMAS